MLTSMVPSTPGEAASALHFRQEFVITTTVPTPLAIEEENHLLQDLLRLTINGKLRWGFQPPSTAQTNIKNLHYVLRLRRGVYRLTARRDGGKTVKFLIERKAVDETLTQLFQLATQPQTAPSSSPSGAGQTEPERFLTSPPGNKPLHKWPAPPVHRRSV